VTAPSSCSWTASSDSDWIGIASGSSGSGNGTVSLSIEKSNGKPRQGSVTIAGQSVTVSQNEQD
jgi:ABC-type histidine transport system ATPase subunit